MRYRRRPGRCKLKCLIAFTTVLAITVVLVWAGFRLFAVDTLPDTLYNAHCDGVSCFRATGEYIGSDPWSNGEPEQLTPQYPDFKR